MSTIIITIGIMGTALMLGLGSAYYLGDDNPIEEACEEIIESQTGKKVDITPYSKEKFIQK